jgi:signal transduction histidine kinase
MRHAGRRDAVETFLWGEVLLVVLLAAALALFLSRPSQRSPYDLPQLRLVLSTLYTVGSGLLALLTATRFSVEGRRFDLLLCAGFSAISLSCLAFAVGPAIAERTVGRTDSWSNLAGMLVGWALIAGAPFLRGRIERRGTVLIELLALLASGLVAIWGVSRVLGLGLPSLDASGHVEVPALRSAALTVLVLLNLLAAVGFGNRFRERREDLDRWLALGATLTLFASLDSLFGPLVPPTDVTQADFLRLLGYGVLVVGVWRAIRASEFGRAVAEERARVAREIHDGLSQYLFAVSTHTAMLEAGADPAESLPRLKEAARAAQSEARFAILALSSAAGSAPFDAALRRYVDFLTADGVLDVELEIDSAIRLAPDEQIEVFRIVQEGLANARKHAGARCAWVTIARRGIERLVVVRDDGFGFEPPVEGATQGLKNMRQRAAAIGGAFSLVTAPGRGTALEIVLRP